MANIHTNEAVKVLLKLYLNSENFPTESILNDSELKNVLPKLNIKDAYDSRLKACEEINRVFGTNWSVKCNINFETEGETKNENDGSIQSDDRGDTV